MTEVRGAAAKPEKKFAYFSGRGSRKEYWVSIGIIFALGIALSFLIPDLSGSGMTATVIIAQIRRLHDFGRTGWWSIAAQAAGVAVMVAVWMLSSMEIGVVVGMAITLAFLVWVGCVRGDAEENRFGKPQTKLFGAK